MPERDRLRRVCVELQSAGIRFPVGMQGRSGGAGPADSRTVIIGAHAVSVPACSWFVEGSPFSVGSDGPGGFVLYCDAQPLCSVQVPAAPELYRHCTAGGTAYEKIALLHGRDCLASTLYQDCRYRSTGEQCRFCGIGLSLDAGRTVLCKEPAELAEAAAYAARTGQASHVTLTCGSRSDEAAAALHLSACVRMIKEHSRLPVHIQICPPESVAVIEDVRAAGADTIGVHIESMNMDVLRRAAPAKAAYGLERYRRAWQRSVELFGKNQVSSFLIAGLGDTRAGLVEAADELCAMGVFPYVLPLRPVPGTPFERERPPSADFMEALYREVAAVLRRHGMASSASRAGCVRCGACSCLALFEDAGS